MEIDLNSPEVIVRRDANKRLRKLNFRLKPFRPDGKFKTEMDLGRAYIEEVADLFEIRGQTDNLSEKPKFNPRENRPRLYFLEKKGNTRRLTLTFVQTYFGIPIWQSVFKLSMIRRELKIISSLSFLTYDGAAINPPKKEEIEGYASLKENELAKLLNFGKAEDYEVKKSKAVYFYKYTAQNRLGGLLKEDDAGGLKKLGEKLPPVKEKEGSYSLVREVLFSYRVPAVGLLNWRALLEVNTGAVLRLFPFSAGITGLVFEYDPITLGEEVTVNDDNEVLNPIRTPVVLQRLQLPLNGVQELRGRIPENEPVAEQELSQQRGYTRISDPMDNADDPIKSPPSADAPYQPAGQNFDYSARSSWFAGVNAYYNVDRFMAFIKELGITHKGEFGECQFPNTPLPLPVDHAALGQQINAQAPAGGDGSYSMGIRFGRISSRPFYLGIATSYRIALHEFGHVVLYDYGHYPHFGFAHSYGDSLGAILHDPISQAPDRFATFPWVNSAGPSILRRHDRALSEGWCWGGSKDNGGYNSEEILSTTLFRVYRSLGGDAQSLYVRQRASRTLILLMLKAVQRLTPYPHTAHAEDFVDLLMEADTLGDQPPFSIDGMDLGASHKVIRWGFAKQGAYQPENAPMATTQKYHEGQPPVVDVYIDDGRNGEYPYIANYWETEAIVNRNRPDGVFDYQNPIPNKTNYLYVEIKNRGTTPAYRVVVKAYHCPSGGGMNWPQDWNAMPEPFYVQSVLAPGKTVIAGPIEWEPTQPWDTCFLATVGAMGDGPNTESVDSCPCSFLVPNDNNIAQRNLTPLAVYGGAIDLEKSLGMREFMVRNPYQEPLKEVSLRVEMPELLAKKNWRIEFPNYPEAFQLKDNDRKGLSVKMKVIPGKPFKREEVEKAENRDILVLIKSEKGILGGITYRLDPDLMPYTT